MQLGLREAFETKICFSVDRKSHPIALEALLSERLPKPIFPEGFWMLEAPIYRRIKSPPWISNHSRSHGQWIGRIAL